MSTPCICRAKPGQEHKQGCRLRPKETDSFYDQAVRAALEAALCRECGHDPESCSRSRIKCCPDCTHTREQIDGNGRPENRHGKGSSSGEVR